MSATYFDQQNATQAPNTTTTTDASKDHRADGLKAILLIGMLLLTFIFGIIPFTIRRIALHGTPDNRRRHYALIFTLLSCYGGGVFLATCLLDLLPDAIQQIGEAKERHQWDEKLPIAEFLVAVGFFLVLFMEQLVMWMREAGFLSKKQDDEAALVTEGYAGNTSGLSQSGQHQHTRAEDIRSRRHSEPAKLPDMKKKTKNPNECANNVSQLDVRQRRSAIEDDDFHVLPTIVDVDNIHVQTVTDTESQHAQHGHSHDPHFDPTSHSTVRAVLLVFALSLHSIFEGLALGLEPSAQQALQVFMALSIHKSLVSFSLGIRLVQSQLKVISVTACCVTFALMAPLGGAIGIFLMNVVAAEQAFLVSGSLTAIACGTFLYVTAFEILPHELNEAGNRMSKLITLVLGFGTITIGVVFLPG